MFSVRKVKLLVSLVEWWKHVWLSGRAFGQLGGINMIGLSRVWSPDCDQWYQDGLCDVGDGDLHPGKYCSATHVFEKQTTD